ncbi:hypothetical protein BX666DRAFT_593807 [Dichotomocladium elegans]|nr:hypothetical protein BX666DRAFT_593807 [Dichotomocladium elegans]
MDVVLISEYEYSPLFRNTVSTAEEIARVKQEVDVIQERLFVQQVASSPKEQEKRHWSHEVIHTEDEDSKVQVPASPEQARRYSSTPDRSTAFTPLSARVSPMDNRYPGYSDLVVNQVIENFNEEKTPTSRHPSSVDHTVGRRSSDHKHSIHRDEMDMLSPAVAATIAGELDPSVEMTLDEDAATAKWFGRNTAGKSTLTIVKQCSTPETMRRTLYPRFEHYEDVYLHSDQRGMMRPDGYGYIHSPSRRYFRGAE